MRKAIKFLKEPFPEPRHSRQAWFLTTAIGFSIFAILAMFQPFGLWQITVPARYFIMAGYGLVTFLIVSLFIQLLPYLFKNWFSENKWVIWKHGVWLIILVLTIGIGNLIYTNAILSISLTLKSLVIFEFFTFTIGIFPVTGSIFYSYIKYLKRNMALVQMLSDSQPKRANQQKSEDASICILGTNKGEGVEMKVHDLLFVKAEGNYIQVFYRFNENTTQTLIRSTLKMMLQQTAKHQNIIQCHRAYIVNTNNIDSATGNAQGLKLTIKDCPEKVPVSRNYVQIIRTSLDHLLK